MNQEIDIMVGGKPVRQIAHQGKIFIIAREGQEYEIRLKNNSTNRIAGVVSVDGINVVDGETAEPKGAGYIINGYGSYTVRGFRTSNDEVHPFIFNKKEKSYASKSENGDIQDCGVIGASFWKEKEKQPTVIEKHIHHDHYRDYPYIYPIPWTEPYRYPFQPTWISTSYTSSFVGSNNCTLTGSNQNQSVMRSANMMSLTSTNLPASDSAEFDMGTQFAKKAVSDAVQTVEFEWGIKLATIKIYYASREMIKAMGVPVDQAKGVTFPEPFKNQGFCKPPKS